MLKQNSNAFSAPQAVLVQLAQEGKLIVGRHYLNESMGDLGIEMVAISPTEFSNFGIHYMLCPATYAIGMDTLGNNWIGMWASTNTPSIGDYCIWGGKVWRNTSGTNGSVIDETHLLPAAWTVQAKSPTSVLAGLYIPMTFECTFYLKNMWIEFQWDDNGNEMGVSWYDQSLIYNFQFNPVLVTDWNLNTAGTVFADNKAIACFNNIAASYYSSSSSSSSSFVQGAIRSNHILGYIQHNIGNIEFNTCVGSIEKNVTVAARFNTNTGGLTNNKVANLQNNYNNGRISDNTTPVILNNGCNGAIASNFCSKGISQNTNNGAIATCSVNVGNVVSNQNNGIILANSIHGDITVNQNNGAIILCSSAVPVNITYNINNGNIGAGAYVANVFDAQVNK